MPALPVIVLDHIPGDMTELRRCPDYIQLSGHTHNGQLIPFNLLTRRRYELSWGYKKVGQSHLFVTSGIQAWGPQVRTAGVSEIMLIDVTFSDR